jgi:hypothetical protein
MLAKKPGPGIEGQAIIEHWQAETQRAFIREPHPDDKEILETAKHDLKLCPELLLIVGTNLGIPGARSIATDFCHAARSVGGASFWISMEEPMWSAKSRVIISS